MAIEFFWSGHRGIKALRAWMEHRDYCGNVLVQWAEYLAKEGFPIVVHDGKWDSNDCVVGFMEGEPHE